MRNFLFLLVITAVMVVLAACQSPRGDYGEELPIPDSTISISPADLRIGPMDRIQVEVFGVPDLDGVYQVDFTGDIKMPLIGTVPTVGKTAGELAFELQERYAESYLQDPDVNVTIVESVGRRVTVDGSVARPGLYDVQGNLTLLQAVTLAGGPSDGANPRKVVIFRQISGERHAAAFNLLDIRNGLKEDPRVYGNDVIVMDGSEARESYGELLRSLPVLAFFLAF
jgi:polysaccharide export outer membrane protein